MHARVSLQASLRARTTGESSRFLTSRLCISLLYALQWHVYVVLLIVLCCSLLLLIASWTYNRNDIDYVLCQASAATYGTKDSRGGSVNESGSQASDRSRGIGKGKAE